MSNLREIESFLLSNDIESSLEKCIENKEFLLGLIIGNLEKRNSIRYHKCMINLLDLKSPTSPIENKIRVKILCNWTDSKTIANLWNKMSKGDYSWNNIKLVWENPADYYVIINSPLENCKENIDYVKSRSIVFRMEPHMNKKPNIWKEWSDPENKDFLYIAKHEDGEYNNCEWHLSKTYNQLLEEKINKSLLFSTILSAKYSDPGHIKRIDFVKFLERKGINIDVYGDNKWEYQNYKGSLPSHCKDNGLFPYKYTFNVENHSIKNYFTEKLIDGILSECLTFYSGCFNIKEYFDERAFVYLELSNFEKDYEIIKKAIEEDWHTKRLPYIKEAKNKILNEMQFFPRLERIINNLRK